MTIIECWNGKHIWVATFTLQDTDYHTTTENYDRYNYERQGFRPEKNSLDYGNWRLKQQKKQR